MPKGNKLAYKNSIIKNELIPSGTGKNAEVMNQLLPIFSSIKKFPPFDPEKATPDEFKARITMYFQYCIDKDIRPGIEALSLALGVSRKTFYAWTIGERRKELQKIACQAKQVIAAYMESISLSGQINPATAIFLFKNWFDYKDNSVTEIEVKPSRFGETMTDEQIEAMIED